MPNHYARFTVLGLSLTFWHGLPFLAGKQQRAMGMKMINSAALVGLPREVLALIRDGVYSLYSLPSGSAARYVLVTNRNEFYFLSADGHPQPAGVATLAEVELEQVVSFSDPADTTGMQMNWAV